MLSKDEKEGVSHGTPDAGAIGSLLLAAGLWTAGRWARWHRFSGTLSLRGTTPWVVRAVVAVRVRRHAASTRLRVHVPVVA